MTTPQKTAQETPDDSGESSYEESSEDLSAQARGQQDAPAKIASPDAKLARADDNSSHSNVAKVERKVHASGELHTRKGKESAQPNSSMQGQAVSMRLTHTQSLRTERKNSGSFAQRQCDELKEKLEAAEFENSLLLEKLKLVEENKMELIDQANEVQKDRESLDVALLARDEKCEQLAEQNRHLVDEVKQYERDQTKQDQENSRLFEQNQKLKEENKRLWTKNNTFQVAYNSCNAKLERQRKETADYRERVTEYRHQRDEIKKQVEELESGSDRLTISNADLKRRVQEAVYARAEAEGSESKFKDAARVWKNKYAKVTQHCTNLAEEISTLRQENAIQDDPSLSTDFASFKYTIRDWCDRVLECKPAGIGAHFSQFPLDDEGSAVLTALEDNELNVLIASLWEWLIKLVFGCNGDGQDKQGHPDLWIDKDTRLCLNSLERYFRGKDPAAAIQWRRRTIQQLTECGLCTGDQRFRDTVDEIMRWVMKSLQLAAITQQLDLLKFDFETQVLREAVDFALKLRRQNSEIHLNILQSISGGLRGLALAKTLKTPGSEQNMVRVCIGPQMKKYVPQSGIREASEGIICEAEFADVPFQRWIPNGICSCDNTQHVEESEVD